MFEPHVPPPMTLRTWLVLVAMAAATIFMGTQRHLAAAAPTAATAAVAAQLP